MSRYQDTPSLRDAEGVVVGVPLDAVADERDGAVQGAVQGVYGRTTRRAVSHVDNSEDVPTTETYSPGVTVVGSGETNTSRTPRP